MLSKKTRYAIIALVSLAKEYGKGAILISKISKEENIPQRFLENILLDLKKMGILGSRQGKTGGYFLLKNPKDVNLYEIIQHFEGSLAMVFCVCDKTYRPCEFEKDESKCKLKKVFSDIITINSKKLKKATLDHFI